MMKIFWLVVALVISFFIGRFSANQSPISITKTAAPPTKQEAIPQQAVLGDANRINRELEAEISELKNQLARQQHQPISPIPSSHNIDTQTPDVPATPQALRDAQEFANQLTTGDNNFFQQFREKFNQEPIDRTWAFPQQQQLNHWLKTVTDLESFSAEEIECRTTKFRITFPTRSAEASNELTQIFSKINQQPGNLIQGAIIYDHSIAGSLCLYITRDQYAKLYE